MRQTTDTPAEAITIMFAPDGFVVRLTGEVGKPAAQQLREQLTWLVALGPRRLILDLSAVKSMDALCCDVFAGLRASMVKQGGEVRLAGMNAAVRAALKASKLQRLFQGRQSRATRCGA